MSEESIENIIKSDSLFASTFFYHYILPDVNFNGHCSLNNNISVSKKSNKLIYFLNTKSMFKKSKEGLRFKRWLRMLIYKYK